MTAEATYANGRELGTLRLDARTIVGGQSAPMVLPGVLLNMGVANTFNTDWNAKFTYNFWRPVTATRNGDMNGNDATESVTPSWTSLNDTPMHPEYPSQAAIINGVAVGILESVFGPQPAITFTTADLFDPNLKRQFNSIAEMDEEHRNVRILGRHPLQKLAGCRP